MLPLLKADFITKLPDGKHSTFGVGELSPNSATWRKMDGKIDVPCGELVPSGVMQGDAADETELKMNEFIVYDVKQIRMRVLVKVKFNFKD